MINILVTGSNGQLGSELKNIYKKELFKIDEQVNFVFTDADTLDISNSIFLKKYIQDHSFNYIINCAAYTNVDLAESEKEKAFNVNAQCVKNIIDAIDGQPVKFIHISTDYVFDGQSCMPYTEDMPTNPQSIYGHSKLDGEKYALSYANCMVIRTSWLYSSYGKNFAKTIHRLAKEKESLNVVFDQIGTPTYAHDLAIAILKIVKQSALDNRFIPGVYHFSNEGVCSWYDFAKIIDYRSYDTCKINHIE